VYLDMTSKSKEFFEKRFPRIYATCATYGLDLASDLAPVSPAAHFMIGGVKTDLWGHTSIPGLYAAGETAATGVHGANRLASNSLLEGLVFGARAGIAMIKDAPGSTRTSAHLPGGLAPKTWNNSEKHPDKPKANPAIAASLEKLQEIMWKQVGILRNGKELKAAIDGLDSLQLPQADRESRSQRELHNLHVLGLLVARSALVRQESRGSHYRSDFPYRDDDEFQKHSLVAKGQEVSFEKKVAMVGKAADGR
jgi:L-aspartate oxidase